MVGWSTPHGTTPVIYKGTLFMRGLWYCKALIHISDVKPRNGYKTAWLGVGGDHPGKTKKHTVHEMEFLYFKAKKIFFLPQNALLSVRSATKHTMVLGPAYVDSNMPWGCVQLLPRCFL